MRTTTASLALLLNALLWGVSWLPLRWLQQRGVHPLWATGVAWTIAALCLSVVRPGALAPMLRNGRLWLLGIGAGLTNVCFNWAVTSGEVVRVVLLFYLMPIWSLLLARWLLAEPIRSGALGRVGIALVGALIILAPAGGGWPLPRNLPDWLALVGGLCFALISVLVRRYASIADFDRALAMFCGGALVGLAFAFALAQIHAITPMPAPSGDWVGGIAVLGLMFLISNWALQIGAARLPAHVTAILMLSEVAFASLSAVALGGEVLREQTLIGGALIVLAATLAAWSARLHAAVDRRAVVHSTGGA